MKRLRTSELCSDATLPVEQKRLLWPATLTVWKRDAIQSRFWHLWRLLESKELWSL